MKKFKARCELIVALIAMGVAIGTVGSQAVGATTTAQPAITHSRTAGAATTAPATAQAGTSAEATAATPDAKAASTKGPEAGAGAAENAGAAAKTTTAAAATAPGPKVAVPLTGHYATVTAKAYTFWQSLNWEDTGKTSTDYYHQTLVAVATATIANGKRYYQLATTAGTVVGYISATAVAVGTQPDGVAQPFNQYATITSAADYTIWRDLSFEAVAAQSPSVFHKTFLAKTVSYHRNGAVYYALYDGDQFFGYINATAVQTATSPAGAPVAMDQYATVTAPSVYTIWANFDWTKAMGRTNPSAPETYQVREAYYHSSGATYYSLYQNGTWQGYINAAATTLAATSRGAALPSDRVVTATAKGYTIWQNLAMTAAQTSTTAKYHETFQTSQAFVAEYGDRYYLLCDAENRQVGYVNAAAVSVAEGRQGVAIADTRTVTLKAGYTLWNDFDWHARAKQAGSYKGQTLEVRRHYNHLNGSRYDSVYTAGGSWLGYVNDAGVQTASEWRTTNGQLRYYDGKKAAYTKTFTVKYYSQLDARWAGKSYGGYNFGATGCGMTSIAMILSGLGKNVTPVTAANYAYKYGHFDRGDAGSWESDLTDVAGHYGVGYKVMSSAAQLTSYLKQGYPATVCLDLGGGVRHIVVLHGLVNGRTTVSDPYNRALFSGQRKISQIWSLLSWRSVNTNRGQSAAVVYMP
ncbi:C39 family peptidase [Lacticaseibacillus parakribbianus]|uniref:C39 family peptidase n=1 Tax=Lacticaseibacillus parakribbianus TaxID=2970927 RepID=UPI0021CB69D2|nr:C39 family peptidase [Lacticaseibacillus parakribbianus]